MDAHTVIETWDESSFDGGFTGLNELRSRRFSGAVETDDTWLFFRDGDPLAVVESLSDAPSPGAIGTFETATGTVHEASNPETASLAAMLALGGEVRGEYFTDDTPLSTVHETLSGGGFTGYVELAENVLSGDYYVVYRNGSAEYLAYVGPSSRLLTGDEAQNKAEGEVGIYSVAAVRLPSIDLPPVDTDTASDHGRADGETSDRVDEPAESDANETAGASRATRVDDLKPPGEVSEESETDAEASKQDAASADPVTEETVDEARVTDGPDTDGTVVGGDEPGTDGEGVGSDDDAGESDPTAVEGDDDDTVDNGPGAAAERPTDESQVESNSVTGEAKGSAADGVESVTTRAVPSLDPDNSGRAQSNESDGDGTPTGEWARSAVDVEMDDESEERSATESTEATADERTEPTARESAEPTAEKGVSTETEAKIESLQAELESLRSEIEPLRNERDRLRERIERFESAGAGTETNGRPISTDEALAGTSLFVREATRGAATLDDAYAGTADRESVAENLRIEYHTRFDETEATVDGEPYERYLRGSLPYRFVEWLVTDVLFEIQSTGSESGMRHLYDAIPEIDRIGFSETIPVGHGKDGRELSFDVVARDRMGEPLVVANLDASREPTYSDWMQPLIADASDVGEEHETLGAVFGVTASFFDPEALETVREATSGSLLSRDKHRSYVKLARKNGYHLCLVEARDGTYHLTVPEL